MRSDEKHFLLWSTHILGTIQELCNPLKEREEVIKILHNLIRRWGTSNNWHERSAFQSVGIRAVDWQQWKLGVLGLNNLQKLTGVTKNLGGTPFQTLSAIFGSLGGHFGLLRFWLSSEVSGGQFSLELIKLPRHLTELDPIS